MKSSAAAWSSGFGPALAALLLSACTAEPVMEPPVATVEPVAASGPVASEGRALAVQSPVWIERQGSKTPLKPGTAVLAGDTLITGKGGRVHLALEDQSTVKLGEDAALEVADLETVEDDEGGILNGTLKVLRGAFRYTTSALQKTGRRRDLAVVIGGVFTAGVRGTDIWGKSDSGQDLICLLEGAIDVSTGDGLTESMDQAGTFYVVPKGQPPKPVAAVPAEKLKSWVPQTELAPETPVLTAEGAWAVGLASFTDEAAARQIAEKLGEQGYPAEPFLATVTGKAWHRVAIAGFASKTEARKFRDSMRARGYKTAWLIPPA